MARKVGISASHTPFSQSSLPVPLLSYFPHLFPTCRDTKLLRFFSIAAASYNLGISRFSSSLFVHKIMKMLFTELCHSLVFNFLRYLTCFGIGTLTFPAYVPRNTNLHVLRFSVRKILKLMGWSNDGCLMDWENQLLRLSHKGDVFLWFTALHVIFLLGWLPSISQVVPDEADVNPSVSAESGLDQGQLILWVWRSINYWGL